MSSYFTAYFPDEEALLKGVREIKEKGLQIVDVLTPFPVHGLDKLLGLHRSRLTRVAFAGGAVGALLAFVFQWWIFTVDYPLNFGGKPFFSVPSFIPITFEMTVLFAAFSMVAAFLISNKLTPSANPALHDERITDDHFLVVVGVNENSSDEHLREIEQALSDSGAEGITLKAENHG